MCHRLCNQVCAVKMFPNVAYRGAVSLRLHVLYDKLQSLNTPVKVVLIR